MKDSNLNLMEYGIIINLIVLLTIIIYLLSGGNLDSLVMKITRFGLFRS